MEFFPNLSLTRQIASFLEQQIVLGRLKPNERIQEIKYATELNVSRNSLREALIVLERRHLIVINPRKGATVKPIDLQEMQNLFDLLSELYIMLAKKIARRWRGNEIDQFFAAAAQVETYAQTEQREEFFKAAMSFPELGFPIVKNNYLENAISDLLPSCSRLLYRLVSINNDIMMLYGQFLVGLSHAIAERDIKTISTAIARFSRRLRWQIFIELRKQEQNQKDL